MKYRRMIDMRQWDITNITDWLEEFESDYELIYSKFRLKVNYDNGWKQYKAWVKNTIEHHDFDSSKYNYSNTIINLQNKKFRNRNKDLCLIFEGILAEGFSNAFAEFLGHVGNVMVSTHRKGMCTSVCVQKKIYKTYTK